MNSKPKQTTTNTQQSSTSTKGPLPGAEPLFSDVWSKTLAAINGAQPQNFVAGPTPAQQSAVGQMLGVAPTTGVNAPNLRDVAAKVSNGFFLDPSNDPTFAGAANAAINPITRQLTEKVLPQITDASIRNSGAGTGPGAYGGPRQDIQENQAIQDWTQTAGDITAKLAAASRAGGMDLIKYGPQLDVGATTAALTPAQITGLAGTQQQAWDQSALQDTIAQFLFPFDFLQKGATIGATGGFGAGQTDTTGTSVQTGAAPDAATQWLQGLTGGAGLAASLFGLPGLGLPNIFGFGGAASGIA